MAHIQHTTTHTASLAKVPVPRGMQSHALVECLEAIKTLLASNVIEIIGVSKRARLRAVCGLLWAVGS